MKERKVKKEWNLRQIGNMALIVGVFAIFLAVSDFQKPM